MIVTKEQIREESFQTNTDLAIIRDSIVKAVEITQLLPLIGASNFDNIDADPANDTELFDLVKPYVSFSVKAYLIPDNQNKTGTKATMTANGSNEQPSNVEASKRNAQSIANAYKEQIKTLLISRDEDVEDYPEIVNKIIIL